MSPIRQQGTAHRTNAGGDRPKRRRRNSVGFRTAAPARRGGEAATSARMTGLRGAALFAGLALGRVQVGEIRDLVPVDRTFTPDPANRAVYDRLYAEFPRLYKAQKGMFARLNPRR